MSEATPVIATPTTTGGEPTTPSAAPTAAPAPAAATSEAKPAEGAAAPAVDPAKPPAPAEPVVPEAYDFKMPDGVTADPAAVTAFTEIAKEMKFDQATAQRFADVAAGMVQRQLEAQAQQHDQWAAQTRSDPDIGGPKLEENLGQYRKTFDTFFDADVKKIFVDTGLGNHPAVIKGMLKIGKQLSEGSFVPANSMGGESDMATKLYPSMTK